MQSKQYFTKIKNYPHEKSTEPIFVLSEKPESFQKRAWDVVKSSRDFPERSSPFREKIK